MTSLTESSEKQEKQQNTGDLQQLQSQHELSAFASMVVTSLPFPPLPVLVLQGQDGEYGMASSYDLLQTAIQNAQLGIRVQGLDDATLAQSKAAVLHELQRDMAALVASSFCADFPDWQAYQIYCGAFREYLLKHYATSTQDLRFYPLDAVGPDSVLMQQGTSHWKASRVLCGESNYQSCFMTYTQMLRCYAADLASLIEEKPL
jgi:hypothetical protein